ncbi:unnamed protein product, partial [Ixodes pacificus]
MLPTGLRSSCVTPLPDYARFLVDLIPSLGKRKKPPYRKAKTKNTRAPKKCQQTATTPPPPPQNQGRTPAAPLLPDRLCRFPRGRGALRWRCRRCRPPSPLCSTGERAEQ